VEHVSACWWHAVRGKTTGLVLHQLVLNKPQRVGPTFLKVDWPLNAPAMSAHDGEGRGKRQLWAGRQVLFLHLEAMLWHQGAKHHHMQSNQTWSRCPGLLRPVQPLHTA
jgi:hypothetical protein